MFNYLTVEQMKVVNDVHDNHEAEFKLWANENESQLMKWYDDNEHKTMFQAASEFAYYCCKKFMEIKSVKVED
jgi:hypothetical protein